MRWLRNPAQVSRWVVTVVVAWSVLVGSASVTAQEPVFDTGEGTDEGGFAVDGSGETEVRSVDAGEPHAADGAAGAVGTIEAVEVECALRQCRREEFRRRLASLSGLREGEPLSGAAASMARANLMATGYFQEVAATLRADGVAVIVCESATLIRNVKIRARSALGSELRRRVFLRSGEAWTGDERLIARQVREIEEYFEAEGFFGTVVDLEVVEAGRDVVDLFFDVKRGRRRSVDRVYVKGAEVVDYATVRDTLLGEFNLTRTFTAFRFERAQNAVVRLYRDAGYIQARVVRDQFRLSESTPAVDLFVEIREGPRWDIQFFGNTLFTRAQLLDATTFYSTGFVDEAEIEIAVGEIQRLYETQGHFFADVSADWGVRDDGTQSLVFDISERTPSEIRRIEFVGVDGVGESELRASMSTVEYDILSVGGYLQRARLANDIEAIRERYAQAGYLNARVTRVAILGENAGRDLSLTLHIDEGVRTEIESVEVQGMPLRRAHSLEWKGAGDPRPFAPDVIRAEQSLLLAELHRRGFSGARVETECFVDGSPSPVPCVPVELEPERVRSLSADRALACDRESRGATIVEECVLVSPTLRPASGVGIRGARVAVRHTVSPETQALFGNLFVQGNFETRRRVIEREMRFRPGDPFDYQEILQGQARLRSLGLFDSVRASAIPVAEGDGTDDRNFVVVSVEESGSRFFDHRLGMEARASTSQGFLLILSNEPTFREINLAGRAKELRVFGNFDFDVLNPGRLGDREFGGSAGVLYLARRFYLTPRIRDPWEVQAQLVYDYDLLAVAPAPLTRELAFDARVREENDQVTGLFFELGFSIRQTDSLDQSDSLLTPSEFESALILSLAPRVTLDRRDNALNPTRGVFGSLEVELADDFIAVLDSERFTKVTARASGFVPLGSGFVLGMNGRFGGAVGGILSGFRSSARLVLPTAERYSLGGVTTVRGFAEGGVSTLDSDEFGGDFVMNGNLELRYPLLASLGLNGAIFVDAGQLAADLDRFRVDGFRATAGFGLRWLIAGVLPVVFDYGAVLERRSGEGFGRLHFNVGYTF